MIPILIILVFAVFLLDMLLTYHYIKTYKKMYPKSAWWLAEANPILKICMQKLGLGKGVVFGTMIIGFMLAISLKVLPGYYGIFLLGMYFSTNIHHFANWQAMKRLIKNKKEVKNEKEK